MIWLLLRFWSGLLFCFTSFIYSRLIYNNISSFLSERITSVSSRRQTVTNERNLFSSSISYRFWLLSFSCLLITSSCFFDIVIFQFLLLLRSTIFDCFGPLDLTSTILHLQEEVFLHGMTPFLLISSVRKFCSSSNRSSVSLSIWSSSARKCVIKLSRTAWCSLYFLIVSWSLEVIDISPRNFNFYSSSSRSFLLTILSSSSLSSSSSTNCGKILADLLVSRVLRRN